MGRLGVSLVVGVQMDLWMEWLGVVRLEEGVFGPDVPLEDENRVGTVVNAHP